MVMWPCGSLLLFMLCRLSDVTQNQTGTKAQGPNPGSTGPRPRGGGVLGPKNDGGVPLAAENWTQKDRGKNEIWGLKDRIL